MNDEHDPRTGLSDVRALEAEGKRRHAEARLRALHEKWPGSQIYRPIEPVPTVPEGDCGRDCGACGVVGKTE